VVHVSAGESAHSLQSSTGEVGDKTWDSRTVYSSYAYHTVLLAVCFLNFH